MGKPGTSAKHTRCVLPFDYAPPVTVDVRATGFHVLQMSKTIQIRDIPDALYRQLEERAASEDTPMSVYIQRELEKILARARRRDVVEAIAGRPAVVLDPPAAEIIRAGRDERGR